MRKDNKPRLCLGLPLASSGYGSGSALRRLLKSIALPKQPPIPKRRKNSFRHVGCDSALRRRRRLPLADLQVVSGGRPLGAHRPLTKVLFNVDVSCRLCARRPADRLTARQVSPYAGESDVGGTTGSVTLRSWRWGCSARPLPDGRYSPAGPIKLGQTKTNIRQKPTAHSAGA